MKRKVIFLDKKEFKKRVRSLGYMGEFEIDQYLKYSEQKSFTEEDIIRVRDFSSVGHIKHHGRPITNGYSTKKYLLED